MLITTLTEDVQRLLSLPVCPSSVQKHVAHRLDEGKLTRDENPVSHVCVYFAAYDPLKRSVFIGHHKKSGLWLFNGGHVDEGENVQSALFREMDEEWGWRPKDLPLPQLITVTTIGDAPYPCREHVDVWHLLPVDAQSFDPDPRKLNKEFYRHGWFDLPAARPLVQDPSTLAALDEIERGLAWRVGTSA